MYVCIYMLISPFIYLLCISPFIQVCSCLSTSLFVYVILMCVCIHNYIHRIHTYIHTYLRTSMHTHTYIYIYMHTCIYTYMHIHVYTHVHTHISTFTYTYIYIYVHTYIYIYTYVSGCSFARGPFTVESQLAHSCAVASLAQSHGHHLPFARESLFRSLYLGQYWSPLFLNLRFPYG